MAWEYFNSLPADSEKRWEWAAWMTRSVMGETSMKTYERKQKMLQKANVQNKATDKSDVTEEAPLPAEFQYFEDVKEPPRSYSDLLLSACCYHQRQRLLLSYLV